ncbi:hypothetical protein Dsin_008194 [Dipteronia sinensis]|uniref:Uncharacterized protein n=1 Tax=Dipteronia sinensis TaxID=43782 RepID=A0AAE0B1Y0_9ROSI|nr:hypothetical protein Dsin_008194 [Dipteronia sinensis]
MEGQLQIQTLVSKACYNDTGMMTMNNSREYHTILAVGEKSTISDTQNKFTVIGCDSYGYIEAVDWEITGQGKCKEARKNASYACKQNSECYESPANNIAEGYLCGCKNGCKNGYRGNPYLSDSEGCKDINECGEGENVKKCVRCWYKLCDPACV